MSLSETQIEHLKWLTDESVEYGPPGGRRTFRSLCDRGLARINSQTQRWEITDAGRMELGPIELTANGFKTLSQTS